MKEEEIQPAGKQTSNPHQPATTTMETKVPTTLSDPFLIVNHNNKSYTMMICHRIPERSITSGGDQ